MNAADVDAHVAQLVAAAPPLSAATRDRLAALLRPGTTARPATPARPAVIGRPRAAVTRRARTSGGVR